MPKAHLTASGASTDPHLRPARQPRRELTHVGGGYGDAAGRRRQVGARQMEEDRAAAAFGSSGEVVIEDEDEIIEIVAAPHAVRAVGIRQSDGTVIAPARGVLA